MRTMTSSIAKTCGHCGTLNRLLILTTGLSPSWRIACSHCGVTLIEPRSRAPVAAVEPAPAPAVEIDVIPLPEAGATKAAERAAATIAVSCRRPPHRHWRSRARSGASTGASFLAACGLILSVMVADRPASPTAATEDMATPGKRTAAHAPAGVAEEVASLAETEPTGDMATPGEPPAAHTPVDAARKIAALAKPEPPRTAPARPETGAIGKIAAGAEKADPPETAPRETVADAPVVPRYRLAAAMALAGGKEAYPDPREGMMRLQLAALADPQAAAEEEARLDLSPRTRREIQRRLRLARHDPSTVDGVFGPATRSAIAAWQEQADMPSTGYVTERTLSRLVIETEEAYRAWRVAEAARRDREQRIAAVVPMPRPEPVSVDGCARLGSGEIVYGQNVLCDMRGLRQRLGAVGETLAQAFATLEPSRLSARGRAPDDA